MAEENAKRLRSAMATSRVFPRGAETRRAFELGPESARQRGDSK